MKDLIQSCGVEPVSSGVSLILVSVTGPLSDDTEAGLFFVCWSERVKDWTHLSLFGVYGDSAIEARETLSRKVITPPTITQRTIPTQQRLIRLNGEG